MKTVNKTIITMIALMFLSFNSLAQESKKSITVMSFDSQVSGVSNYELTNLLRSELKKINKYNVLDIYDTKDIIIKHNIDINCFGRACLVKNGEFFATDYIMSGSLAINGRNATVTLWIVDVKTEKIVNEFSKEYNYAEGYINLMFEVALKEMFGIENNAAILASLEKVQGIPENKAKSIKAVKASGVRFGMTYFTGWSADILQAPLEDGGFDVNPYLSHMGYQFEKAYVNTGSLQMLVEIVPAITGVDQGMFIPSINILHGIRTNKRGLEFAFGPTFNLAKKARGHYNNENKWILGDKNIDSNGVETKVSTIKRVDSRGEYDVDFGLMLAFGKTFSADGMNIPINIYYTPSRNGGKVGLSLGFNFQK